MKPRTYASLLIGLAFGLFATVVGLNLLLDPQGIFGNRAFGPPANANDRYHGMRAFQAEAARYDGIILGSSRGHAFPPEAVALRMGAGDMFNLSVYGGGAPDFAAVLEYLVRTRRPDGKPIRAAFMLLDADRIGDELINRSLQTTWPPEMTGESEGRFTWRYLTAIQPKVWSQSFKIWRAGLAGAADVFISAGIASARADTTTSRPASPATGTAFKAARLQKVTDRVGFEGHLASLRRAVEICRAHDIQLVAALSPLNRDNVKRYSAADIELVVQKIAEIVPVWDFGSPQWLSDRGDLWADASHFKIAVAKMMLDRIFEGRTPAEDPAFGRLRTSDAP